MKKVIFIVCLLASINAYSQDQDTTYWKISFKAAIPFNQASFSDNWSGGGINSLGLSSLINYRANYLKGKNSWDNEIDLTYGFTNNSGQGFRKNSDRIFLDTKYGRSISEHWNMFGSLNIQTQFVKGYKYEKDSLDREVEVLISDFMAPGYFTASLGFEYTPKPFFKLRLSPFAPRLTVVRDKELYLNVDSNYGVEIGETTRWEWLAFQMIADFDKDLTENLNLKFKYQLFANLETLEFDKIDHRLDAIISAKVAKYFDVKLSGILLYDFDQIDEVQLSQGFGLGFAYTFKNYTEEK
jgi:hypothetical protein